MTIDAWITAADPSRPALEFEGETLTYGDMARRIAVRSAALVARGVGPGDRVAWYGLNHPEVFVLLFACARLGAMLLPLNWRLSDGEIDGIVADADPALMVHDGYFAAQAARFGAVHHTFQGATHSGAESPQGLEEHPVLLVYTSGATCAPKGVVLTQAALASNARMSVHAHGLTPQDRVLNALPLFHVGGLNILPTPAFSIGATVVLHDRFEPQKMATALAQVHHAITVPTVLDAVMHTPGWREPLGSLRTLSIGSTDVPLEMIEAVQARGVPVLQIYGATETCPLAIYQTAQDALATTGSIGRAGVECEIRLVSDDQDVPDGRPGEILVRGPNVFREYWRNPDLTSAALEVGWFRTGDVAWQRDGLYHFADRIKHVIISGGENIYPAEIERILRAQPGVTEVAVVGRPDLKWGEVPVAVVVGEAEPEALLGSLQGQLARYKHPKDVVYVDALPRNAMGKVVAAEVRKLV